MDSADPEATQTITVTGAGGYLGSRLVALLTARPGVVVRAVTRTPTGLPDTVEKCVADLAVDDAIVGKALDGATTVIHLAGPSEAQCRIDPGHTVVDVVSAAMRLAEGSAQAGASAAIYLSTTDVYGARLRAGAHVDEGTTCEPQTAYAIGRLAAEELLSAYGPPRVVVFRLGAVVGAPATVAAARSGGLAADLCRRAIAGEVRLPPSDVPWRDFVAVDDVCRIVADAATSPALPGGTYNLGLGRQLRMEDLACLVQDLVQAAGGSQPTFDLDPGGGESVEPPKVSVDRLRRAGYRATVPLAAAAAEMVSFFLAHRDDLAERD